MNDFETETGLVGFADPGEFCGIEIRYHLKGEYLNFTAFDGARKFLTNPAKLADGRTAGEANQRWLHEKLDAFLAFHTGETK